MGWQAATHTYLFGEPELANTIPQQLDQTIIITPGIWMANTLVSTTQIPVPFWQANATPANTQYGIIVQYANGGSN